MSLVSSIVDAAFDIKRNAERAKDALIPSFDSGKDFIESATGVSQVRDLAEDFGVHRGFTDPLDVITTDIAVASNDRTPDDLYKAVEDAEKERRMAEYYYNTVLPSISESAAEAAKSASFSSKMDALQAAEEKAKRALKYMHAAEAEQQARQSGGSVRTSDVVSSAAEGYNESMNDPNYNLPNQTVKSDFSKYLLVGGGLLLAYYIIRGRKNGK